jgi:hypothetical protein
VLSVGEDAPSQQTSQEREERDPDSGPHRWSSVSASSR